MYGIPGVYRLSEQSRAGTQAIIKRASKAGRRDMRSMLTRDIDQLERLYQNAADDIREAILARQNLAGNVSINAMQDLLAQVNQRLADLGQARDGLLSDGLAQAAQIGATPFSVVPEITPALSRISNDAVQFVQTFVAEDGLQLSDRLWRLDRHARDLVGESIESAIIQGNSAAQATEDFLARGTRVPPDVAAKMGMANADKLARVASGQLLTGEGSPFDNALRVFTTELNRAHGEAYRAGAFESPDVIGTKFLLSPRHPRVDICDMHASVNRYGLGPGVYPKGKSPWPAHPNTLSFEVVVFRDEVTDEDKKGKETRIDWLKKKGKAEQDSVLGSRMKRRAVAAGVLKEGEIATPWNVLKKKYKRKGIDLKAGK